ncbi:MAG TPA: hypothetical protein VK253_06520 [Candidatus Binatia bacterium]|nr:hypothetical protein [Candidatus Binatia bacterium]
MNEKKLVTISIKRKDGEVEYKVDCSKEVTSEELAHYLDEIIEGICTWKPEVCEDAVSTIIGTIKNKQKT